MFNIYCFFIFLDIVYSNFNKEVNEQKNKSYNFSRLSFLNIILLKIESIL